MARVIVGMSGGVDSSVAAAELVERGHEVLGATILVWSPPGMESGSAEGCCGLAAAEDARRVCARLGIRHYVLDLQSEFYERVVRDYVEQYLAGRTPNPCVLCNEWIKFDALWEKGRALGADAIATGHYARVRSCERGFELLRGLDSRKDQSYALYRLKQDQLARLMFPLGEMQKSDVRRRARDLGLPTAGKPDSQETCFVPSNDYPALLRILAPEALRPGDVVDAEGRVMGEHSGVAGYTIGQRRRINVGSPVPLYVTGLDPATNRVTVGPGSDPALMSGTVEAERVNLIGPAAAPLLAGKSMRVQARIRYNARDSWGWLDFCRPQDPTCIRVRFDEPVRAVSPGQSLVCYDGDRVIGGGIIERASASGDRPDDARPLERRD